NQKDDGVTGPPGSGETEIAQIGPPNDHREPVQLRSKCFDFYPYEQSQDHQPGDGKYKCCNQRINLQQVPHSYLLSIPFRAESKARKPPNLNSVVDNEI